MLAIRLLSVIETNSQDQLAYVTLKDLSITSKTLNELPNPLIKGNHSLLTKIQDLEFMDVFMIVQICPY